MKPVVICGMHRSGTSMLAQVAHHLGLDFGPESDLMPATLANPEGYFENRELSTLQDELLAHLGGAWDHPPQPAYEVAPHDQIIERFLARGRAWTQAMAARGNRWGWKDPRSSLLLPFWQEVLGENPRLLICLRHPEEVANSLHQRRDALANPLPLWLAYQQSIERSAIATDTLWLNYESFFAAPAEMVHHLADFLELASRPDQLAAATRSINPYLHRNRTEAWDPQTPPEIREQYTRLAAGCWRPTPSPTATGETVSLRAKLTHLEAAYANLQAASESLNAHPLECRIYWQQPGKPGMQEAPPLFYRPGQRNSFAFTIPDASGIKSVRLDVSNRPGEFLLESLVLSDPATGPTASFGSPAGPPWALIKAAGDCGAVETNEGLAVLSYAEDPMVLVPVPKTLQTALELRLEATIRYDPNSNPHLRAWINGLKAPALSPASR